MSVAKVLQLADYRDRRDQRSSLAKAFAMPDRSRRDIVRHLGRIAALSGADRVATVWIDEYGPGLIHPYAVLDLLCDTPRREFRIDPLQRAWEIGVPGAHDDVVAPGETGQSTFAIALGSDGVRAWFVVAESSRPRPALGNEARRALMFLGGECSAVALHRDLGAVVENEDGEPGTRFAGWSVLKDLEGREEDEVESRRIAQRFVVARLARMLIDNDLVMAPGRISELASGARKELEQDEEGLAPAERRLWVESLDAFEHGRTDQLAAGLVDLGLKAEERGHFNGATELYTCAYGLSSALGRAYTAAAAARLNGRVLRRGADHEGATRWYSTSLAIATEARLEHVRAIAMAGLANVKRERGNVPAARDILGEALGIAQGSGHADTVVQMHREWVALERSAGNAQAALQHGWRAVGASSSRKDRARNLASLAGALEWAGDHELAGEAWSVVAESSSELYLRALALDALSHLAALRGDQEGFESHARRCDELDHETVHNAHVQILHYRGLSYRSLGMLEEAEAWLRRAVEFAEKHGFNETLIRAEADLEGLGSHVVEATETAPVAPPVVREGVRAMRQELVGATG